MKATLILMLALIAVDSIHCAPVSESATAAANNEPVKRTTSDWLSVDDDCCDHNPDWYQAMTKETQLWGGLPPWNVPPYWKVLYPREEEEKKEDQKTVKEEEKRNEDYQPPTTTTTEVEGILLETTTAQMNLTTLSE